MSNNNAIYFNNLNGIRFIAAMLVIIHHVEQFKSMLSLPNMYDNYAIHLIGKLGVLLFFVLSGFLITYLLMEETSRTGKISIQKFYLRRILRIWPLYFLLLVISFIVLPKFDYFQFSTLTSQLEANFWPSLFLFITFLPNVSLVLYGAVPFASQAWSVGVEEQFYLTWPWLVKYGKNIAFWLAMVLIGYNFVLVMLYLLQKINFGGNSEIIVFKIWSAFNIDSMAVGGLGAFFYKHNKDLCEKYCGNITLLVSAAAAVFSIWLQLSFSIFTNLYYSLIFLIILLSVVNMKNKHIHLEYKIPNYLGKISYGLYMYHPLAIFIVISSVSVFGSVWSFAILPVSVLLTIGISMFSYEFYEKRFLRLKQKYTDVPNMEVTAKS